jgi:hypothetical protein
MVKPTHASKMQDSIFSDETRFLLSSQRRPGERFAKVCVMPVDRFAGDSFMVLGGVYCAGKNNLIVRGQTLNVQRYCDNILRTVLVPFMRRNNRFDFQQDNARPDTACLSMNFLQAYNINK